MTEVEVYVEKSVVCVVFISDSVSPGQSLISGKITYMCLVVLLQ